MDKFADEASYNQQKEWEAEQEHYASESAIAEANIKAQEEMEMASELDNIEEVKKFRKKPVVVEAFQWWQSMGEIGGVVRCSGLNIKTYEIKTLEGRYIVSSGDWIITGVKGEKYPCKPDIFELTYEICQLETGAREPCIDCPNINIDDYGYLCDLTCGKRTTWLNHMAGIREAVEWIEGNIDRPDLVIPIGLWDAKLKEWGIKSE